MSLFDLKGRVLVVGDVMTDIVVRPEGPLVRGSDRKAEIDILPGGSGANQAVWLAHFGIETALVARVGQDDLQHQRELFEALGILPFLQGDSDRPTGRLVTVVDDDGERSFFTDRGANVNLSADDLPEDCGALVVSGYALFEVGPRAAVRTMMAAAQTANIPIIIDPGSASFLKAVGADNFRAWTEGADLIVPNAEEAEILSGETDAEAQIKALGETYRLAAIKLRPAGSAAGNAEGVIARVPAEPVEPVDSTGAGDAFLAGFLSARSRGEALEACLQAANAAGGAAVQKVGGRP